MNNDAENDPIPEQEPVPMEDTIGTDSAPGAEAEPEPAADGGGDAATEADTSAVGEVISDEFDELDGLMKERDEYLDALRRTQADFENYRKRMQREALEAREAGAAGLAAKLVDVLDVVDYALGHDPSDAVAQISAKLDEVLLKEGLERIDAFGAPFDPELHDAVLHEEGDGAAEVIEVLRSGWRWRDKVLRAAMVKVKGS